MTLSLLFPSALWLDDGASVNRDSNITLKNLAKFRPKLCDSYSTNQIARFVNYCCYSLNVIEFSIRLKNWKHSHGIEIQRRDSIIIPLMIEENRAKFFRCFIVNLSRARFTAGIQGTHRHKSRRLRSTMGLLFHWERYIFLGPNKIHLKTLSFKRNCR